MNLQSLLFRLRLLGEPASFHSFSLLEELQDRPEAREAENAKQHRDVDAINEQRADAAAYSHKEERWPALHAEVVFALDDERMEEADAQESAQTE